MAENKIDNEIKELVSTLLPAKESLPSNKIEVEYNFSALIKEADELLKQMWSNT